MQRENRVVDREVDGERIRIVARTRTYMGKPTGGFNVTINGKEYYARCLSIDEAMDKALARFIKWARGRRNCRVAAMRRGKKV